MSASTPSTRAGHEGQPTEGSAYSVGVQPNTGKPASLVNPHHYPVEAICKCGEVIRCQHLLASGWVHTGRRPGEPDAAGR